MMAMLQNSFANSSFSLLVGKIQGTIVDYLMPPLAVGELIIALVGAAVTRAVLVGLALWLAMLLWPGVHVGADHLWAVAVFGVLGAMMLGFLGLMTSVWAEKFDHAAAVTNFRSEEHTSELQSLMRISYAVFCLKKKKKHNQSKST